MSLCPILAYKVELYLIDLRYYNGVITTTAYSPTGLWDTYPFCKFNPSLTGHTKNRMFCRKLITNLIMDSYIWSSLCPYKEIYRPHGIICFVSFFFLLHGGRANDTFAITFSTFFSLRWEGPPVFKTRVIAKVSCGRHYAHIRQHPLGRTPGRHYVHIRQHPPGVPSRHFYDYFFDLFFISIRGH